MQSIKRIGSGILFGSLVFLLFLVFFEHWVQIPSWLAVAGRLHPMLLHFPIVLLLLSFFIIWIPGQNSETNKWLFLLRLSAALSAVITAVMGVLLSLEDNGEGNIVVLHKWGGVAVAILGYLFFAYYGFLAVNGRVAKLFTLIATGVIVITGHWGASLTHGDNYVFAPIQKSKRVLPPPDKALVFADIIQPILDDKCTSCHNRSKLKGELLLENLEGILQGGETGALFLPGQPDSSLLIHRLHLPVDDKKHMPPANRPQLTETESALLYAWIKSGAPTNNKLFDLPEQDTFRVLATTYLQPPEPTAPVYAFEAADYDKILSLNNNYRVVAPLGKNSPALAVNLYGRKMYKADALKDLLPVKQQIVELNLSRLPVKDEDIQFIRQMVNLEKLNLNYTDVTDKGVAALTGLSKLRELSLSGTTVSAVALEKILPLPQLSSIYVWDTHADSTQINALKTKYADKKIETGYYDNGNLIIALSPPVIKTPPGIFSKPTTVDIRHPIHDVVIRYTLDGNLPDSVNGLLYTQPIPVDQSVTLVATAYKKGWYGSSPARATYIKKGYTPDTVTLISPPDPKYSSENATLLSDGILGDFSNHANGEWLGYQKNEAAWYLFFNAPVTPKNVLLQMMQNTGAHIFPPASIEVWAGKDKEHLKLAGKLTPRLPEKNEAAKPLQENIPVSAEQVQCIKLVIHPVDALPSWHGNKGSPAWIFLSEIVVN